MVVLCCLDVLLAVVGWFGGYCVALSGFVVIVVVVICCDFGLRSVGFAVGVV